MCVSEDNMRQGLNLYPMHTNVHFVNNLAIIIIIVLYEQNTHIVNVKYMAKVALGLLVE